MNTTTTPPNSKKATLKCIFAIRDHEKLVKNSEENGIKVHKDSHGIFGCVFFDNTVDYNDFKAQLA